MNPVTAIGPYKAEVVAHGITLSSTKKCPQLVLQTKMIARYVDSPEDIAHFELDGPAWVDYTPYEQTSTDYFVLFNSGEEFTEETKNYNYGDIQRALGWDGTSFDDLGDGTSFVGKQIIIRMGEDTYQDKTRIRAQNVDNIDAEPYRGLKTLAADELKGLSAKLKGLGGKPKAAPKAAAAATPAAKTAPKAAPAPAPAAVATAPAPAPAGTTLPTETTKDEAWAFICDNKGGTKDKEVQDAWVAACTEVSEENGNIGEDKFTGTHWARIRDIIVRDLALNV